MVLGIRIISVQIDPDLVLEREGSNRKQLH